MKVTRSPKPQVHIRTVHEAEIQWFWKDKYLHDMNYTIGVRDKIDAEVRRICDTYEVTDDTTYCCQWEGRQFQSEDRLAVEQAMKYLGQYLTRFKGIDFLAFDEESPTGTQDSV